MEGIKTQTMEINLILIAPNAMIMGWQYYDREEGFEFKEINIYLVFMQLQFRY